MKLMIFSFLGFLVMTCFSYVPSKEEVHLQDDLLISTQGKGFVLLYKESTNDFFLLQTLKSIQVPENLAFRAYNGKDGKLFAYDQDAKKEVTFSLGNDIYGIANMRGEQYNRNLLNNSGGTTSLIASGTLVIDEALDCHCVSNGTTQNCEQGGPGSSGCEVTDGGSVGGVSWSNHCQVSCSAGYYSCCTE